MKNYVSYERTMRERAVTDRKGLYTIDLINAGKTPGKLGGRMTLQGPASAEEQKAISDFIVKLLKDRATRTA